MSDDLAAYLNETRPMVEKRLDSFLQPVAGLPEPLREAMRYSLLGGGKRLRPILTLLACEAAGGAPGAGLVAGCAVEMVHTYSLIHDDLPAMDDDDLRRGQPTCHKKFGEAMAILAGDALLTLAFQVVADSYPPRTASGCMKELAIGAGMAGMVGGQVDDLAWEKKGGTLEDLEFLHARKTGALFRASLLMGAWTAQGEKGSDGPDGELLAALADFGRYFGLAFQITDDLLDVEGDVGATGKGVNKDAVRGKLTYPGLLGVAESRKRADRLCEQAERQVEHMGAGGRRLAALARSLIGRDR